MQGISFMYPGHVSVEVFKIQTYFILPQETLPAYQFFTR